MTLKRALITGSNAGIGKATAEALAAKGWEVILAGRNTAQLQSTAAGINETVKQACASFITLDLSDMQSVRQAAAVFCKQYDGLGVLINNAGVYTSAFQFTADGYEMQFGVNHLGHFLLSTLLLPQLQQASGSRLINVASRAHLYGQLDFETLRGGDPDYSGLRAYARSKLANVIFTAEWARRYPEVAAYSLHPGGVATDIATKSSIWYIDWGWKLVTPFLRSPARGAATSVYLATVPEVPAPSGAYFNQFQKPGVTSGAVKDPELAKKLWVYSEEATGES